MPPLRELERRFAAALLDGDERAVVCDIEPDAPGASARLAVYRHHVLASLTAALASTFPVVRRLVDPRFFGWLADRYLHAHPPTSPCLFELGHDFADFVAAFPACAGLPWLPDVARLEWAMNQALHADDIDALDAASLAALTPSGIGALVVRLHPSVTLLASRWPVDAIWRANRDGAVEAGAVGLDSGGVRLEIRRSGDDVVLRALPHGTFALRVALAGHSPLEAAFEAALAADPLLDVTAEMRALLDERLLVRPLASSC
ncbi:MAG TPA: DNA-binding domain-containing protein [Methylomirabilota bacterium]|jgi:hypothetical protein|nr:DNA-binding domain-containing protein [Methylomirabilota bacterium]